MKPKVACLRLGIGKLFWERRLGCYNNGQSLNKDRSDSERMGYENVGMAHREKA